MKPLYFLICMLIIAYVLKNTEKQPTVKLQPTLHIDTTQFLPKQQYK